MKTNKTTHTTPFPWKQESSQISHLFQIMPLLKKMPAIAVSDVLAAVDNAVLQELLNEFEIEFQVRIFTLFSLEKQLSYFQHISKIQFALLFDNMSSDQRINWFQMLTVQEQIDLWPHIIPRKEEQLILWSSYKRIKRGKKTDTLQRVSSEL